MPRALAPASDGIVVGCCWVFWDVRQTPRPVPTAAHRAASRRWPQSTRPSKGRDRAPLIGQRDNGARAAGPPAGTRVLLGVHGGTWRGPAVRGGAGRSWRGRRILFGAGGAVGRGAGPSREPAHRRSGGGPAVSLAVFGRRGGPVALEPAGPGIGGFAAGGAGGNGGAWWAVQTDGGAAGPEGPAVSGGAGGGGRLGRRDPAGRR